MAANLFISLPVTTLISQKCMGEEEDINATVIRHILILWVNNFQYKHVLSVHNLSKYFLMYSEGL